jgi:hypothetical protein
MSQGLIPRFLLIPPKLMEEIQVTPALALRRQPEIVPSSPQPFQPLCESSDV